MAESWSVCVICF